MLEFFMVVGFLIGMKIGFDKLKYSETRIQSKSLLEYILDA